FRVADRLGQTFTALHFHDSSSQSGLAMVNVTNGADVDVRFGSLKRFFCHLLSPACYCFLLLTVKSGAHDRDRTDDLVLTKDVLCQLSYMRRDPNSICRTL